MLATPGNAALASLTKLIMPVSGFRINNVWECCEANQLTKNTGPLKRDVLKDHGALSPSQINVNQYRYSQSIPCVVGQRPNATTVARVPGRTIRRKVGRVGAEPERPANKSRLIFYQNKS